MFFVPGVSWVDIDDNKLPDSSSRWKLYGLRMTPAKDNKLEPIAHVMATIGSGNICWMFPDKLPLKLVDILKPVITHVLPPGQESQCALLDFFH